MQKTKRRDFLKSSAALAAQFVAGQMIVTGSLLKKAQAATGLPIQDLVESFANDGAIV